MILIFGSSGFIGQKLIGHLENQRIKYKCAKLFKNTLNHKPYELLKEIKKNINQFQPDVIINLHAQTDIEFSYKDPFYDILHNSIAIIQILVAIKETNKKIKFINTGTVTQIGFTEINKKINHNFHSKPTTIFDLNKQYSEDFMSLYSKKFNLKSINVRLSNVIGHGSTFSVSRGAVNKMILNAIKNKNINIYDNGKYKRDFISVDDVCKGLIKISKNREIFSEDYVYLCSGKGTSLIQLSLLIKKSIIKLYNFETKIDFLKKKLEKIDKRSFVGNTYKLEKYLNWKPKKLDEKMIFDIVKCFKISNLK